MTSDETVAPPGLVRGARRLVGLMPHATQRAIASAAGMGAALAGLEFLAVFLLYPVFGFLSQGGGASFSLPLLGTGVDRALARWMAVVALTLMIFRSVAAIAYRRWWLNVAATAELQLSDRLLRTYAFAPYSYHLGSKSTDLMARAVANVNLACQAGLVGIVGVVSTSLLVAGLALALILASPVAGVAVGVYVGLIGVLYTFLTRGWIRRLAARLQQLIGGVYAEVHLLLRGIRELTVFGQRDQQLVRVMEARKEMVATNARVSLLADIPRVVLEVTLYSTLLVVLAVLLSMTDPDSVLPLVALYVVGGLRIMPTLAQLLGNVGLARTGIQLAGSLADEMDRIIAIPAAPSSSLRLPVHRDELRLERVAFSYGSDLPRVLTDVNLELPFGTFLGLVGESGSGKTTLTSIILGLLAPTGGTMRYGGMAIPANDPFWFERVSVVPQDVFLTGDSLRSNILAGAPEDAARLVEVLELAGLGTIADSLERGLDTLMLDNGGRLSAGQRQRVGLARALYRSPEILVLDEPTSALDSKAEARIMETIIGLRGKMTVIAVAHRTHTLAEADVVARLEGGLLQLGSPWEMIGDSRSRASDAFDDVKVIESE